MERVAAVVTISDGVSDGTRTDESGDAAEAMLRESGWDVRTRRVVPDERPAIESVLRELATEHGLVVTSGGTGFGPRDVTPEATRAVVEREAPGIAELMRGAGLRSTPMAALSRAAAGALGSALIVNLPGSPSGVRESLQAVLPVVPHAVELLAGSTGEHPTGHVGEGDPPSSGGRSTGRSAFDAHASEPPGVALRRDRADATAAPWVEATAVSATGSPPCRVGDRMGIEPGGAVSGTLGCAEFDEAAVGAAKEVYAAQEAETRVLHHELGDIEVFFQPSRPMPRLVVMSATDVARSLRAHANRLGYVSVLVESRGERLRDDDRRTSGGAVASIDELDLPGFPDPIDVVLTDHDAPGVTETLAAILRTPVRFIGVMGSRRHVGHYVETLRQMGFSDDELARIRSPLGLDLGGRGPEEIALSIAAGLVAQAHGRDGGWLDTA